MTPINEQVRAIPAVSRVYQNGYEIQQSLAKDSGTLELLAFYQGRFAGSACVCLRADGLLHSEGVSVIPEHQQKGLATAMYVCAEQLTGRVLIPGPNQTKEGKALWDQANRPFGNPCPPSPEAHG